MGRRQWERQPDSTFRDESNGHNVGALAGDHTRAYRRHASRPLVCLRDRRLGGSRRRASITNANGSIAFPGNSYVRGGWTAGGGVEAAIVGNWSAKLEYLFVGLENHGYFVPTPNNPNFTNRAGGAPLDNNIVRGGINYKFGWL